MSRVVHFEFPSTDMAASRKFYENVLGWTFFKYPGPMEYWLATTGAPEAPGINGALGGAANELNGTVNTVEVDNLDETLQKAAANGDLVVMPKDEIPEVGWLAYIREPGGAVLGLIQRHPDARM